MQFDWFLSVLHRAKTARKSWNLYHRSCWVALAIHLWRTSPAQLDRDYGYCGYRSIILWQKCGCVGLNGFILKELSKNLSIHKREKKILELKERVFLWMLIWDHVLMFRFGSNKGSRLWNRLMRGEADRSRSTVLQTSLIHASLLWKSVAFPSEFCLNL